jgi:hypothetical protein
MVRSSQDINWVFQANMQFLEDYFWGTDWVALATVAKVRAYVAGLPGITLDELLASLAAYCSRDEVYFLSSVSLPLVEDQIEQCTRAHRNDQI